MIKKNLSTIRDLVCQLHQCCLRSNYLLFNFESTNKYNQKILNDSKKCTLLPNNQLIICIGNDKTLWDDAKVLIETKHCEHPFDGDLNQQLITKLSDIMSSHHPKLQYQVFYTHKAKPYLISFQDLAVITRLGKYHKGTSLIIHPVYGPWVALRLALLIDIPYDAQLELHSYKRDVLDVSIERNTQTNAAKNAVTDIPDSTYEYQPSAEWEIDEANQADKIMEHGKAEYSPSLHIKARSAFLSYASHRYSDDQLRHHYHL